MSKKNPSLSLTRVATVNLTPRLNRRNMEELSKLRVECYPELAYWGLLRAVGQHERHLLVVKGI